jgi:carboxyl-terminal processing protease
VLPGDAADPSVRKTIKIVREKVKLAKAASKGEVKEVDGVKIGVIDVPSFYADTDAKRAGDPNWASTARDTQKILADFHTQGVNAVVVDLRSNGGGALDQAVELTGLFLKDGPVVQIRDRRGQVEVLNDEDPSVYWEGPLVVLTSEASASASEIFAAAIQDHHRGIVVGSPTTHGKGTVQNLLSLDRYLGRAGHPEFAEEAGAIKFTTHKFYRVNGGSTQIKGVSADVVLPSPWEGTKIKESDLEHPLAWDSIAPAIADKNPLHVNLAALQMASDARVKSSLEFRFLAEDVQEREAMDAKKTLSLYEPERRAELERFEKIDAQRKAARIAAGEDPEKLPDYILDEALHVTRDMVRQLRG